MGESEQKSYEWACTIQCAAEGVANDGCNHLTSFL